MVRLIVCLLLTAYCLLLTPAEALVAAPKEWELPAPPEETIMPSAPKMITPVEAPFKKMVEKLPAPGVSSPEVKVAEIQPKINFSLIISALLVIIIIILLMAWYFYPK